MININNYLNIYLILTVLLFFFSVHKSKNLFSPISLFTLVFAFSTIFAYYSKDLWDLIISKDTFIVLILGIFSFLIIGLIIAFFNKKKIHDEIDNIDDYKPSFIDVDPVNSIIVLIVCMLLGCIYFYYVSRLANTVNLLRIGSIYRNLIISGDYQISLLGRLSLTILRAISVVIECILVNNFLADKKKFFKNNSVLIFSLFIYLGVTVISGERTSLLRICGVLLLCFSVLWQRKNNFKKLISIKFILIATIGIFSFLYAFSAIRFFVGRSSKLDMMDYISLYAGGPIYNINYYVNKHESFTHDGRNTFVGLYNNFARLGFNEVKSIHRETVKISGKSLFLGNVYTCFYDYYKDFGLYGVIILTSIYSIVINLQYYNSLLFKKKSLWKVIIYSFFGTTLLFASFTEQFYSSYFSISTIESILVMFLTLKFITSVKIKIS